MTKWQYLKLVGYAHSERWDGWRSLFNLENKKIRELFKSKYSIWVWKYPLDGDLVHALQSIEERLNELGQQGWENYAIVTPIEAGMYASSSGDWAYYFKRPVAN